MKNTFNNPMRYKTISEMSDSEVGYISKDSLCFDIQEKTGETIYAIFHYEKYSTTISDSELEGGKDYDIEITCHIKNDKPYFSVNNPYHHLERKNLKMFSEQDYTIIHTGRDIVDVFDANREMMNDNDLYEEIFNFIEQILENIEEEEHNDKKYNAARNNFSYILTSYCNPNNWEEVEKILRNAYNIMNSSITPVDDLLEILSDYTTTRQYLEDLLQQDISGYIDETAENQIIYIADQFNKLFYRTTTNTTGEKTIEKENPQKSMKELEEDLEDAISKQDFEKATEIRNEIEKLKGKK